MLQTDLMNVTDLKQYLYCPRIVYYRWVMPVVPPATHLMNRGKDLEEEFERLEPRRTLSKYGLEEAKKHFQVQMTDPELGLTGKVDLLLESKDQVAVVEVKATEQGIFPNQEIQIGAYALLAEAAFKRPCPVAFCVLLDTNSIRTIEVNDQVRGQSKEILRDVKKLILEPALPEPTSVRKRCENCEYRNFCSDIF